MWAILFDAHHLQYIWCKAPIILRPHVVHGLDFSVIFFSCARSPAVQAINSISTCMELNNKSSSSTRIRTKDQAIIIVTTLIFLFIVVFWEQNSILFRKWCVIPSLLYYNSVCMPFTSLRLMDDYYNVWNSFHFGGICSSLWCCERGGLTIFYF